MLKRTIFLSLLLATLAVQYGCAAVAGGAVGAAIGHEVAEREHEDDD
jgi:hypothetical protein